LGKDVPVRTALPEEQVRRVEQYVTERLERLSGATGSADTLLMATLALMQLAEECIALRDENSSLGSGLDERLTRIVRLLDVDR
jgi:cell division protein ZapA